ncbi:MAG TPA: glycogen synthase GlgA [Deltaproteobacteria bacterium]|nr:glycogen synthase GlgA [Deltaproteobacteria bacterium]
MADERLKVLFASPEAVPFAKTGGLADVAGALPAALAAQGADVTLIMPFYRQTMEKGLELTEVEIDASVGLGPRELDVRVLEYGHRGVRVLFIRRDEFYDRGSLYGTPDGDYFDNLERFVFFSRAVVETARALGLRPDIFHLNDWQTGLVPAFLKDSGGSDFPGAATVFTIHNIAYQGLFPPSLFHLTGLDAGFFHPDRLEFWGRLNLLKGGIVLSDAVTTVSEAYSREIQTEEFGCGLEGVLRARSKDLYGVLNGVDYSVWDPSNDEKIAARYSASDLSGKEKCKADLLGEYAIDAPLETPLIGIISRLTDQKGFDILAEAMDELMAMELAMVVLGTGERRYQELFTELASRHRGRLGVKIAYDDTLAHKIEAGCDMFLMPSRYEPCGLNQIYSLRYGTIPIVRATGGLDDTIRDYDTGAGNGFKFTDYTARALVEKVKEAIWVYGYKEAWRELQARAMREDFSWERSAARYMEIYRRTLAGKKALS